MATPSGDVSRRLRSHHARILEWRSMKEAARELTRTGSEPEGVGIMTRKARLLPIWLDSVSLKASPLLKQEMLSVGADAAQARGVADHSVPDSAVILLATLGQYRRVIPKLKRQPFGLKPLADELEFAISGYLRTAPRTIRGLHRMFEVGTRPLVMGVLNVTPDSFSDGGRFADPKAAIAQAQSMVEEGADLIDVGAESSRPGAAPVSPEEEWRRLAPVLDGIGTQLNVPISVDTQKPDIARKALEAGADLVNDVGGLRDPRMRQAVRDLEVPVIVMHMAGTPETMQRDPRYADVRGDVFSALADSVALAEREGISRERLLIDPGLGFGKTGPQNLELLSGLGEFRSMGLPVVVGASRKSFLGALTRNAPAEDRLEASIAAAVMAADRGADILRVHDVMPTVRALAVVRAVRDVPRDVEGFDDPWSPGED